MNRYNTKGYDDDSEEDFDGYSQTSWEKDPFESNEDYADRIQDLEDYLESFD